MAESRKVIWEDPPPSRRGGRSSKFKWFRSELMLNPNRSARFPGVGIPRTDGFWEGFEFVRRGEQVYAKYVGPAVIQLPKRGPGRPRKQIEPLPPLVGDMDRERLGGFGRGG